MICVRKEKGDYILSVAESSFGYSIMLWQKGPVGNELCEVVKRPKYQFEKRSCLMKERQQAWEDFASVCAKISDQSVNREACETSVCSEPCEGEDLSFVLQTKIGTLELKKSYPLSLERFVQAVFGISDMWNPEMY